MTKKRSGVSERWDKKSRLSKNSFYFYAYACVRVCKYLQLLIKKKKCVNIYSAHVKLWCFWWCNHHMASKNKSSLQA